jgi:hypothetical protein
MALKEASPMRHAPRLGSLRRTVRWTVAGATIGVVAAGAWWVAMPGDSHRGMRVAATPQEAALAAGLRRDVEAQVAIGDRHLFKPRGLQRAADWVAGRFEASGLTPSRLPYQVGRATTENIEVVIPGATRPDEILVVGAHYDSTPGSPAANDNASGVAAILAMAPRVAATHPARTVRFVAFANEELGFQTEAMGSLVYAKACRARNERIVGMIALDTVGMYVETPDSQRYPLPALRWLYPSTGDFVTFVANPASRPWLSSAIGAFRGEAAFPSEGLAVPEAMPGSAWSDHWAFWQVGYPALMVSDTALFRDETYHTAQDRPEHLNYAALARVTVGLTGAIARLASN